MKALWSAVFVVVFAWSAIKPYGWLTWFLGMLPALATVLILGATRARFPLTPIASQLLLLLCVIILIGAHYSSERVPLFDWIRSYTGGSRNNFDKFAHFFQGFVPAIAIREILVRFSVVLTPLCLAPIVVGLCLAVSAAYELVEWAVALTLDGAAEAFTAARSDPWDAQSDMALALLGAICALVFLSRVHDRQLGDLPAYGAKCP